MGEKLKLWCKWMLDSNRFRHLISGFIAAALCGIGAAVVGGIAVEYQEWRVGGQKGGILGIFHQGNGFDWVDLLITTVGGVIGAIVHFIAFGHLHL